MLTTYFPKLQDTKDSWFCTYKSSVSLKFFQVFAKLTFKIENLKKKKKSKRYQLPQEIKKDKNLTYPTKVKGDRFLSRETAPKLKAGGWGLGKWSSLYYTRWEIIFVSLRISCRMRKHSLHHFFDNPRWYSIRSVRTNWVITRLLNYLGQNIFKAFWTYFRET